MALIRKSDIDEVRARTNIVDVISDYVTLRSGGVGSMKGLCPFHDERTPSFNVRPAVGHFHCFGCGESGDVYSFLQKIDHVTFAEAVERLAARIGFALTYEDGGQAPDHTRRLRLLQANTEAHRFFVAQLGEVDAAAGRDFLGGRGFDPSAAEHFGVGYAPKSWDALTKHLTGAGYSMQELRDAGLVSTNDRGSSYDRFRGRVVWPIRDTAGQTLGFGARKLFDDDQGPKYLNTPETPVYHKAQVLYGLDLAKREIAKQRSVVVVEGYTDVMAAHVAGVATAVATCGTSFGVDHIKVLRRILDDESGKGRVVFTFDPDEAGQQAAMKAFAEERRFVAQTYVAVGRDGLDPCDLRLQRGDAAVRDLVEHAVPMHEFVIKRQLRDHDLETVEGRVAALRQAAPVVAGIRDPSLRPGYARQLARWLGMDLPMVERAVQQAGRGGGRGAPQRSPARSTRASAPTADGWQGDPPPDHEESLPPDAEYGGGGDTWGGAMARVRMTDLGDDPITRLERDTIMAVLQLPGALTGPALDRVLETNFSNATLATVRDGILATRGSLGQQRWLAELADEVPSQFRSLVSELAMAPLPAGPAEEQLTQYARAISASLVERDVLRRKAEALGSLQRTDAKADPERFRALQAELVRLEELKRALREE